MEFETEYQLKEFREDQKDLFDNNDKRYDGVSLSNRQAEIMLSLINQLEVEINRLEKKAISNEMIAEIYKAFELLGAKSDLLGIIGSYKDTMNDTDCLNDLINYNSAIVPE